MPRDDRFDPRIVVPVENKVLRALHDKSIKVTSLFTVDRSHAAPQPIKGEIKFLALKRGIGADAKCDRRCKRNDVIDLQRIGAFLDCSWEVARKEGGVLKRVPKYLPR